MSEVVKVAEFDFDDLEIRTIPVKYQRRKFILREADGGSVVAYRNKMTSAAKLTADGKMAEVKNIADAEPYLVSLCLFELNEVNRGEETKVREVPVTLDFVRSLPNKMMAQLYKWIKDNSDMTTEEETEATLQKDLERIQGKLANLKKVEDERKNALNDTEGG